MQLSKQESTYSAWASEWVSELQKGGEASTSVREWGRIKEVLPVLYYANSLGLGVGFAAVIARV